MHQHSRERFLLRLAEVLHAHGTPANRLERVLSKMADALGVRAVFLITPTSVLTSFGNDENERTHLRRIEPGELNLGKLVELDDVMEAVEHGRATVEEGLQSIEAIALAGSPYSVARKATAFGLTSACAARLLGGGIAEVLASAVLGPLIFALSRALPRRPANVEAFEPLAAFLAAFAALVLARLVSVDDRVVALTAC